MSKRPRDERTNGARPRPAQTATPRSENHYELSPETIEKAKRLEGRLRKWLEKGKDRFAELQADPAAVMRRLEPSLPRGFVIDHPAIAGFLETFHGERDVSHEERDLFTAWWEWVNASNQNFAFYRSNPVGSVPMAAGASYPPEAVNRLMAAVAYVTGCHGSEQKKTARTFGTIAAAAARLAPRAARNAQQLVGGK
jgi:hypothetical protein